MNGLKTFQVSTAVQETNYACRRINRRERFNLPSEKSMNVIHLKSLIINFDEATIYRQDYDFSMQVYPLAYWSVLIEISQQFNKATKFDSSAMIMQRM